MFHCTSPFADVDLKFSGGTALKFSGYASVFGGVDSYGDTMLPGAYSEVLKARNTFPMYFNHGWKRNQLPIGRGVFSEDERGLRVDGELTRGLAMAENVYVAMKHGTVDGLSVAIQIADADKTDTGRIIKRIGALREASVVDFPADEAARIDIDTVKSMFEHVVTIKDFEDFLREAGGFSKSLATATVGLAKRVLTRGGARRFELPGGVWG